MKDYIQKDEWKIIEKGFNPENNRISESIFSIGNGHMGQRANFEESYSGDSLQGSYMAGVYYPDKTRVGWWKNGYPEYFAKIVNSINWIGVNVILDGQELDLAKCIIHDFERVLDMKRGLLTRHVEFTNAAGNRFKLSSTRFLSVNEPDASVLRYSITPISTKTTIRFEPYLDGDVTNEDSNYDENFWFEVSQVSDDETNLICMETLKTGFQACAAMKPYFFIGDKHTMVENTNTSLAGFVSKRSKVDVEPGQEFMVIKYVAIESSLNIDKEELTAHTRKRVDEIAEKGFGLIKEEHEAKWSDKWLESDIKIEGDVAAQQAIRYNIFQLYQTYTGDDPRLNIGPKGFTGEKYGGVTYWDTEAYCLPFYLRTADHTVSRNLLKYRHNHLQKAIENAEKLGFSDGAALYPMVTINGEECHNEWEITFEEIHRNGAIAYAIYNYVNYTGDNSVISEFALEVLIAISRFWKQRVSWSEDKNAFVILGVTGPNEYENNVSNNWYTNTIAKWTMEYTIEQINRLQSVNNNELESIFEKVNFNMDEISDWQNIVDNIYQPYDGNRDVFLQQDGFLDKELIPVKDLPESERPIHKKWSWDRILRSCYIKQADVLQGLYMLEDRYDLETIKRNFYFYEPYTVHESSLSASVHCIMASAIGNHEKAYEMYLRSARLDLDDYNDDTNDGLHITSMGGTWMSIVEGFAGLRVRNDKLILNPIIPESWKSYSFRIVFRNTLLKVSVKTEGTVISNDGQNAIEIVIGDKGITIPPGTETDPIDQLSKSIA
ncbi:MAG: family 65 glycosyl hydrolase domain-containing protein [Bacteroidota bacterium]